MGKNKNDELIDSHVSASQCQKAIAALIKHTTKIAKQKEETELLPGREENVWLVLSVKKVTPEKKLKPFRILLAHPIVDPRTNPICLITKDPQREYKDLLESHNIKFINRVVGVEKLKGKFKPFEARRMLLKENELFLADERVVPLLPGLLGKIFFKSKKQPIPVSLTKKELKKELEQAVTSTYMHQNQGTCTSIKIGRISQSAIHILENLKTALPEIVKRIGGGWDNVQSFHVKTNSSTSLPIWSCALGEGENARWEEPTQQQKVVNNQSSEEYDSDKEPTTKSDAKDGKKRAAVDDDRPSSKKPKKTVEARAELAHGITTSKSVSSSQKPKQPSKPITERRLHDTKNETKKHKDTGTVSSSDAVAAVKAAERRKTTIKPSKSTASKSSASETQPTSKKPTSKKPTSKGSLPQAKPTFTNEDIKKKRLLREGLEKKKGKLVKKRLAGSIKEDVIGKKSKSLI